MNSSKFWAVKCPNIVLWHFIHINPVISKKLLVSVSLVHFICLVKAAKKDSFSCC